MGIQSFSYYGETKPISLKVHLFDERVKRHCVETLGSYDFVFLLTVPQGKYLILFFHPFVEGCRARRGRDERGLWLAAQGTYRGPAHCHQGNS
ncbi:unnamed protein product [Leptosia nina]|uniref:Uncharacterized protein n=1 Tax=Leptosia nina TaxID=320188 RepID=A0AAV1J1K6_9NEOP